MDFCLLLLFAVTLIISYICVKWPYDYWRRQGIESAGSTLPIFGNTLPILLFRECFNEICTRLYKKSKSSMIGMFHMSTPVLIIREPELVRTVQVKDFNSFRNNTISVDEHRDPFTAKHPFFAKDDNWKETRTRFASGMSSKKLKIMFQAMERVSLKFDSVLERMANEVNLRQLCLDFTSEIVCNSGFGIEYNETYVTMAGKIFEYTWINEFRHLLNFYLPKLARALKFNFESEAVRNYFEAVAKRIVDNGRGDDFVRMTMETSGDINVDAATSLISGFYIDATATTSNAISMILFRLSKHQEVQDKVRSEICEILDKNNGKLSYEALKDMTYLKQVINETLRLHPVIDIHAKLCTEITTLVGSDGQKCTLQPDNIVILPVLGIHTDERYWRDPETFDPDRFSENRKDELTKFAFLPFGEGPRQCPGMRYGTIETKIVLITILRKYKLLSSDKINFPLQMDNRCVLRSVKGVLWAHLVPI